MLVVQISEAYCRKTVSLRLNTVCWTGGTHGEPMTTYYDVPAGLLISSLAEKMQSYDKISAPEWASQIKTGTHRERPPVQDDWWHTRAASILRKVAMKGPIGTNRISQEFGGAKDRGVKKNKAVAGSRNVARKILQQLAESGLIENSMNSSGTVNHGRIISSKGHALLDLIAHSVRGEAEEKYPGLERY
ncbi:MAG: 30S ribosomal protein S19e [Candidatus Poseidoniia archaeon]